MKLHRIILSILISVVLGTSLFAKEEIVINFKDLEIKDFINITSKILNKNILLSSDILGKVKFVSNKKIYKEDVLNILIHVLESKGFTLVKNGNFFKIVSDRSIVKRVVEVIRLKNADSKNVIAIIEGLISQRIYKYESDIPFASVDDESNSIILMGPQDELLYLKKLITQLDLDRQQVYVKARIIEVSENETRNVGIKYGLSGSIANSNGLTSISAALSKDYALQSIPLINNVGTVINSDVLAMGVAINLLNQNGAANIVSEPSILCINNKESSIYVGETKSIITGTTSQTDGQSTSTYTREDIGLTLKVKPRISNANKVTLELSTVLEDASQDGSGDTSKKEVITTAIVNDGESVILGGYIKEKNETREDKVPFFGDIPLLGNLFRNNLETSDKINLVIIVTPYIVPKSKDLTFIRNQLAQLKTLEDKYTKDVEFRLEQTKNEDKIKSNTIDEYNKKRENIPNKMLQENEIEHQKRLKNIFHL
ncbi:MAG: secretin N-terminal domain-containing protein [Arcobacteraceae bacterium]